MSKDQTLRKIKALFKKTQENGASQAEAQAALAKARELMREAGISEDSVLLDQEESTTIGSIVDEDVSVKKGARWRQQLAVVVEIVCDVQAYYRKDGSELEIHFIGLPSDVEIARATYVALLDTILQSGKQKIGKICPAMREYCAGFVSGLISKARESQYQDSAQSTAIVHVKKDAIAKWTEQNLKLKNAPRRKEKIRYGTFDKGFVDGRNTNIGGQTR